MKYQHKLRQEVNQNRLFQVLGIGVLMLLAGQWLNLVPEMVVFIPTTALLASFTYVQFRNNKTGGILFGFLCSISMVVWTISSVTSVSSISLVNLGIISCMIGFFAFGTQYVLDSEEF